MQGFRNEAGAVPFSFGELQKDSVMATRRTAILIRCSCEEAAKIREMAKRERRTLSGFVLHTLMSRIARLGSGLSPSSVTRKPSTTPSRRRRKRPGSPVHA